MRWLLIFVLASIVFSAVMPYLRRFGIGKMPFDFSVRIRGREFVFPFGSTIVLTVLVWVIGHWL
jgi:hypothetical protein